MKLLNRSAFFKYVNLSFILKVFIIFSVINILLLELRYIFKEADPSPKIKIYLKGLITNPESLFQGSLGLEKQGRIDDSIIDMKLAISLVETGNYSPTIKSRYEIRLKNIEKKAMASETKN